METIKVNFAKQLGKKILINEKELILHSVTLGNYILAMNGDPTPKPFLIEECKLILDYEEIEKYNIPPELAVIPMAGKYIEASKITNESLQDKEDAILIELCKCAKISISELNSQKKMKIRKRELVQIRQIHFTVMKLFTKKEKSLSEIATVYGKDHATVLHSIKTVKNACDGKDIEMRTKYASAFRLLAIKFPKTAHKELNLDWL